MCTAQLRLGNLVFIASAAELSWLRAAAGFREHDAQQWSTAPIMSSSHPSLETTDYHRPDLTRHYPVDLPGLFDHHLFVKIAIIDAVKKSDCLLSCRSR
jgi:hypothetical protein